MARTKNQLNFATYSALPTKGNVGVLYITTDTNKIYRWNGSAYIELSTIGGVYTTATDPAINAATSTVIIDGYDGVIVTTTTTGNAQTLQNPTITTPGKVFTVVNNDTSTNTFTVNGSVLNIGMSVAYVWDGSVWTKVSPVTASDIINIPAGNISATNVQLALNELDTEKLALAGGTMTGSIALGGQATTGVLSLQASGSSGICIKNTSGQQVACFGAGGGQGTTLDDGLVVNNAGTFNNGAGDFDFTIKKNSSGNAYVYDAGLDTSTFGSNTYFSSANDLELGITTSKTNGFATAYFQNDAQKWTIGVSSDDIFRISNTTSSIQTLSLTTDHKMILTGGGTVLDRIECKRGTDDTTMSLKIGYANIDVLKTSVNADSNEGLFIRVIGNDVTKTAIQTNFLKTIISGKLELTSGVIYPTADGTTALQINKANGTTNIITIDTTNGIIKSNGGLNLKVTTVNASTYTLLNTDYILNVTYTATGAVTSLTLPTAQTTAGRVIIIKDAGGNSGTNNITIDTEGSEKIDGADTYVIDNNYEAIHLYSDGSNWFIY